MTFSTFTPSRLARLISSMTKRRASSRVGNPASTLKVRIAFTTDAFPVGFRFWCGSRRGSDFEIGYGAGGEKIEAHRATFARSDFIHDQTRLTRTVDEHANLRFLDHDFCVKPHIAIGRRFDGLFILTGLLLAKPLPTPVRMRSILHGVGAP